MKKFLLAVTLLAWLVLGARDVRAQVYGSYYGGPYWDVQYQHYLQWQHYLEYLRQNDPYYELHLMHYQLYLQPHQPYQVYQPCCYGWAVIVPQSSTVMSPRAQTVTRSEAAAGKLPSAVSALPQAVSPLPRAAGPLPQATGRR